LICIAFVWRLPYNAVAMRNRYEELDSALAARELYERQQAAIRPASGNQGEPLSYAEPMEMGGDGLLWLIGAFRKSDGQIVSVLRAPDGTIHAIPELVDHPEIMSFEDFKAALPDEISQPVAIGFVKTMTRKKDRQEKEDRTFDRFAKRTQTSVRHKPKPEPKTTTSQPASSINTSVQPRYRVRRTLKQVLEDSRVEDRIPRLGIEFRPHPKPKSQG